MPPTSEPTKPLRFSVQIKAENIERLDRVSEKTGISRPQLVDHLIERQSVRELISQVREAGITPRPVGKAKQSVWRK